MWGVDVDIVVLRVWGRWGYMIPDAEIQNRNDNEKLVTYGS